MAAKSHMSHIILQTKNGKTTFWFQTLLTEIGRSWASNIDI